MSGPFGSKAASPEEGKALVSLVGGANRSGTTMWLKPESATWDREEIGSILVGV